jgi:hypothetical protein
MIDPRTADMARWDMVTSLALIYTVVMSPVEVAFLPAPTSAAEPLFVINRLIDCVFLVDIGVSFFTMFRMESGHAATIMSATLVWEVRLPQVARHYARGWFPIDVLSVLPSIFDIISMEDGADECVSDGGTSSRSPLKLMRMIRILRLFKLVRLLRASRLVARFERRNTLPYSYISFVSIIFQVRARVCSHTRSRPSRRLFRRAWRQKLRSCSSASG